MYPSQPLLVTWGGTIGQGAGASDVWQCGLHMGTLASAAVPDTPTVLELDDLFNSVVQPYHTAADTNISPGAVLRWAKAAVLTTAGKYAGEAVVYEGAPYNGGGPTDSGSPQLSTVVTLWSGQSLGKGNFGRYYLPWNGRASEVGTGRMSSTSTGNIMVRSKTFLTAVNEWGAGTTGGTEVLIFGSTGSGTKKRPAFLRVGDVVDTQRRRRNRIKEQYSVVSLSA